MPVSAINPEGLRQTTDDLHGLGLPDYTSSMQRSVEGLDFCASTACASRTLIAVTLLCGDISVTPVARRC